MSGPFANGRRSGERLLRFSHSHLRGLRAGLVRETLDGSSYAASRRQEARHANDRCPPGHSASVRRGDQGDGVTPLEVARDELHLPVVEAITWEAVTFLCAATVGGPVSQDMTPDGDIVERQSFSTKFPHIVIERTDRYASEGTVPAEITWARRRVQNPRTQTQVNRALDPANLAVDLVRAVR